MSKISMGFHFILHVAVVMQEVWTLQGLAVFWEITHPGLSFQPGLYQGMPVALFFTLVCLWFSCFLRRMNRCWLELGVVLWLWGWWSCRGLPAPWTIWREENLTDLLCLHLLMAQATAPATASCPLHGWGIKYHLPPSLEGGSCSCSPFPGRRWDHRESVLWAGPTGRAQKAENICFDD